MLLQSKGFFARRSILKTLVQTLILTALCWMLPATVLASGPRVVLLPNQMSGGPDVVKASKNTLGPKLANVAEVVPYASFVKAGRKAGIRSGKMATAKAIKRVGKKLNIDLAIIVEGFVKVKRVGKKRRKRKRPYLRVAMINVANGKLLYTNTWALSGGRLKPQDVANVVSMLKPQIQKHAPVRAKKAEAASEPIANLPVVPAVVEPPVAPVAKPAAPKPVAKPIARLVPQEEPPPPPPPEPEPRAPEVPQVSEVDTQSAPVQEADPWAVQGSQSGAADPWATGTEQGSGQADPWATPSSADADPWSTGQDTPPATAQGKAKLESSAADEWAQPNANAGSAWGDDGGGPIASRRDDDPDYGPAFRRAIRFMAGAGAVRREAAIPDPNVEGQSKISYGLGGGLGSFSPGGVASLDIYPLRFADIGGILGGFGITLDFSFFPRSAYEADSQGNVVGDPITSNVMSLRGGLLWDFALWEETTAPQIGVVAGYHYYTFPLDSGAFPGVEYTGPYFGTNFQLPMSESFQIVLAGDITIPMAPGGGTSALGNSGTGYGFGSTASMVFSLLPSTGIPIEFELGGRYDSYNCSFEGETSLGGNVEVMQDVELRDVSWSGFFMLGFSL